MRCCQYPSYVDGPEALCFRVVRPSLYFVCACVRTEAFPTALPSTSSLGVVFVLKCGQQCHCESVSCGQHVGVIVVSLSTACRPNCYNFSVGRTQFQRVRCTIRVDTIDSSNLQFPSDPSGLCRLYRAYKNYKGYCRNALC